MTIYYTIYQTTNNINGKIYIGKHQTTDLNDGYLGSGIQFNHALKKYGVENFTKEILFVFDTKEEMESKEIEIVNEEFICRNDTYNIMPGGQGGWSIAIQSRKEKQQLIVNEYLINPNLCCGCNEVLSYKSRNNKYCSHYCQSTHQNPMSFLSEDRKREAYVKRNISGEMNGMYGKNHTPQSIEKMKLNRTSTKGKPKSEEHKQKLKLAAIKRWAKKEEKEKQSSRMKGRIISESHRNNIRAAAYKYYNNKAENNGN